MDVRTARAIGEATTNLLLYAKNEKLDLTTIPITVKESGAGAMYVTLHACKRDGSDYEIRLDVGLHGMPSGAFREWDGEHDEMTTWSRFDTPAIYHMDELYA